MIITGKNTRSGLFFEIGDCQQFTGVFCTLHMNHCEVRC